MLVSSRRKNPESVMAKLACDYSLLIQIHTEGVLQIAITEDEKYSKMNEGQRIVKERLDRKKKEIEKLK